MRKEQLKEESKKSEEEEEEVKMEAETIENGVGDHVNRWDFENLKWNHGNKFHISSEKSDAVVEGNLVEDEQKAESPQVKQEENHTEFQIDTSRFQKCLKINYKNFKLISFRLKYWPQNFINYIVS